MMAFLPSLFKKVIYEHLRNSQLLLNRYTQRVMRLHPGREDDSRCLLLVTSRHTFVDGIGTVTFILRLSCLYSGVPADNILTYRR